MDEPIKVAMLEIPAPDPERCEVLSKLAHDLLEGLLKSQPDIQPSEIVYLLHTVYEAAATALMKRIQAQKTPRAPN